MEKIIEGFPSYKINDKGEVFSNLKGAKVTNTWRKLTPVLDKGVGYYLVTLTSKNPPQRKNRFIHRLLAQAFIPNPENKPQVNHKDGVKTNNSLDNLEWVTSKENTQHAIRIGLSDPGKRSRVPIAQYILDGKYIRSFESAREAFKETGVAYQNISKVLRGIRKHAGGYFWKYINA